MTQESIKVRAAMARFPSVFGLRSKPGDTFRITERDSYVSGGEVMLYVERYAGGGDWNVHTKGSAAELRREMIAAPRKCPLCGDAGPHADNMATGADRSFSCQLCGTCFDA